MLHHLLRIHTEQQHASLAIMESLERNATVQERRAYQKTSAAVRVPLPPISPRARDCLTKMTEPDDVVAYLVMFKLWEKEWWVGILAPFLTGEALLAMWSGSGAALSQVESNEWMNRYRHTQETATRATDGSVNCWSPNWKSSRPRPTDIRSGWGTSTVGPRMRCHTPAP
ncbi:hypothetical protein AAFF_G00419890 [Aldrovandia affinis]|uniref:Uncharacterized protein n=1 Tax=Aldrovandia affinis TaxID=143900 RepID=A0AAD7SA22_9TELE|nr:hypothetical protein AAFF_G00419890 [Aldrovandia affinis]